MVRLARLSRVGSRLVSANVGATADAMQGAHHLLTEAGRQHLTESFRASYTTGADAVTTTVNTAPAFLDSVEMFSDLSRPNDISFYEVGRARSFEIQGNGYYFNIPRELVSDGEKLLFSQLLLKLATRCAKRARDEVAMDRGDGTDERQLVGVSLDLRDARGLYLRDFSNPESAETIGAAQAPNSRMLGAQMRAAAEESPDFFAVSGCTSMASVRIVIEAIQANARKLKKWTHIDLRGMEAKDSEETWRGFEIPVLIMSSVPACQEEFRHIFSAAAENPLILGVAAPSPVSRQEIDELLMEPPAPGRTIPSLLGPSEATGELAVLA